MALRPRVTKKEINQSLQVIKQALYRRLNEKGYGSYASTHEMFGILDEEVNEVRDEIRQNSQSNVANELVDVAVTAIFGHACIKAEKVDW